MAGQKDGGAQSRGRMRDSLMTTLTIYPDRGLQGCLHVCCSEVAVLFRSGLVLVKLKSCRQLQSQA